MCTCPCTSYSVVHGLIVSSINIVPQAYAYVHMIVLCLCVQNEHDQVYCIFHCYVCSMFIILVIAKVPLPERCRLNVVDRAPEQRNPPKVGFYANVYNSSHANSFHTIQACGTSGLVRTHLKAFITINSTAVFTARARGGCVIAAHFINATQITCMWIRGYMLSQRFKVCAACSVLALHYILYQCSLGYYSIITLSGTPACTVYTEILWYTYKMAVYMTVHVAMYMQSVCNLPNYATNAGCTTTT